MGVWFFEEATRLRFRQNNFDEIFYLNGTDIYSDIMQIQNQNDTDDTLNLWISMLSTQIYIFFILVVSPLLTPTQNIILLSSNKNNKFTTTTKKRFKQLPKYNNLIHCVYRGEDGWTNMFQVEK